MTGEATELAAQQQSLNADELNKQSRFVTCFIFAQSMPAHWPTHLIQL